MSPLRKWTQGLRGKLILLGIISPFAVLLTIFYSQSVAHRLEERIRYAYQVRIKIISHMDEMAGSIHALGRWMWIVNGLEGQGEKQARFLERAKKEIDNYETSKKLYLALPRNEKMAQQFATTEVHWSQAKNAAERAILEYAKGTAEASRTGKEILLTDFMTNLVPITTKLNEIGQGMDRILLEEIAATNAELAQAKMYLWLLGSTIALLTLGLAVLIAHRLVTKFSVVGHEIGGASKDTASASQQLSSASQSLSGGASTAAASLEETVSSLEELSSMVKRNAENAQAAEGLSNKSRDAAEAGRREITSMVTAMSELAQSSQKIEEIIQVIDDIAFQTNLLALNAAVEAARAGEQGKGFAVVAEAVRSLAQRSSVAAKDISDLIEENVSKTRQSVEQAQKNGNVLAEIVNGVVKVTNLNQEIAHASQEQATGLSQISVAMNVLDKSIQENAASSEEVAASSEEMSAQVQQLSHLGEMLNELIDGPPGVPGVPASRLGLQRVKAS